MCAFYFLSDFIFWLDFFSFIFKVGKKHFFRENHQSPKILFKQIFSFSYGLLHSLADRRGDHLYLESNVFSIPIYKLILNWVVLHVTHFHAFLYANRRATVQCLLHSGTQQITFSWLKNTDLVCCSSWSPNFV